MEKEKDSNIYRDQFVNSAFTDIFDSFERYFFQILDVDKIIDVFIEKYEHFLNRFVTDTTDEGNKFIISDFLLS